MLTLLLGRGTGHLLLLSGQGGQGVLVFAVGAGVFCSWGRARRFVVWRGARAFLFGRDAGGWFFVGVGDVRVFCLLLGRTTGVHILTTCLRSPWMAQQQKEKNAHTKHRLVGIRFGACLG